MRISESTWLSLPKEENSFWLFGTSFECKQATGATLEIAADKELEVRLNGELLPFSQLSDLPPEKSVTIWKVSLRAGLNHLNVSVYNMFHSNFCYNATGCPGLAAIVYGEDGTVFCRTDESWSYIRDPGYVPGIRDLVSGQLGMCFSYDARNALDWRKDAPLAGGEPSVAAADWQPSYKMREIPVLDSCPLQEVRICACGFLLRVSDSGSVASICTNDLFRAARLPDVFDLNGSEHLAPGRTYRPRHQEDSPLALKQFQTGTNGVYIIIDLGRETVGFLDFTINAPSGTVVDVAHGEHLDDGRVRCFIDGRNFADRYVCSEGLNHFTHRHRRIGARYLELHITGCDTSKVALGYVQLVEQCLPLPQESEFFCDDRLLLRSREVAIHTLRCCMHEHYEDCPWREQSLYAYDSRNQALYGYYIWGNYKFAASCFSLLGANYFKDGLLSITSPSEPKLSIPSFTLVWVADLFELYLYSGDYAPIEKNKEMIVKVIETVLKRKDTATGLYEQQNDKSVWNFFEWVPGLSGSRGFASENDRLNACFNAYFLEALKCANALLGKPYEKEQTELAIAIRKYFQNGEDGYFRTMDGNEPLHQHTQALMILNKVVVPGVNMDADSKFLQVFKDDSLVPVSFSAMPYYMRAWMEVSPESRAAMEKIVNEQFPAMLYQGATSFWETDDGGDAFAYAGSMCHAWSSLPIFYCHAYVLGVEPLEPGFKKFRVRPYPGSLPRAKGTVPTPFGSIRIEWSRLEKGLRLNINAPAELEAVIESFPEFPISECNVSN